VTIAEQSCIYRHYFNCYRLKIAFVAQFYVFPVTFCQTDILQLCTKLTILFLEWVKYFYTFASAGYSFVCLLIKVDSVIDSCLSWQPVTVLFVEWFHCICYTVMWLNKILLLLLLSTVKAISSIMAAVLITKSAKQLSSYSETLLQHRLNCWNQHATCCLKNRQRTPTHSEL